MSAHYQTKKHVKSSGKNIFSFLSLKKENLGRCFCTLCQLDVPFRIAARCSACQGYCHEQCAIGSKVQVGEHVEFLFSCKRCNPEKVVTTKKEIVGDSPTSPLLLQGQESQHPATVVKGGKQKGYERSSEYSNRSSQRNPTTKSGKNNGKRRPFESVDQSSEKKPTTNDYKKGSKKSSVKLSLGLIWKKRNPEDTGIDFRLKNLLLKDNPNGHLLAPECHLCMKPYNSDLMYIRCEKCEQWFHADAYELKESKIWELMGFKCCRCRRIRIPICPYTDPETRKKLEAKRKPQLKQMNLESDSNSETNDVNDSELDATPIFDTEDDVNIQENDSLYAFPTVEPVNDHKLEVDFEPGAGHVPKKLSVRRHIKSEKESDGSPTNNLAFNITSTHVRNVPNTLAESSPIVEWNVPANGYEDDMMFDYEGLGYEDMEFEPQTYFSVSELLASGDGSQPDKGDPDPPGDVIESLVNLPAASAEDCNPEQYQMGITYDQQEPMFSVESALDMMPCRVCSQTEPCPDLYCQVCSLWIHQHCSPRDEESSWEPETGWKCGHCRE